MISVGLLTRTCLGRRAGTGAVSALALPASMRSLSTESKEQSNAKLSIQIDSASSLTDLEMRDAAHNKKRLLANQAIKMKTFTGDLHRPGSTHFRMPIHSHLHQGGPVRELTVPKKKTAGRNHTGKITVRGRGGGHKQRVRLLDYFRTEGGRQTVVRIEYDPLRSAHIALIKHNETGNLSYILASNGLRSGDIVESFLGGLPQDFLQEMRASNNGEIDDALLSTRTMQRGNCMPLRMVPIGTIVHNVGLQNGGPGKIARAAGTYARLLTKYPERNRAVLRMCSGEHRYVPLDVTSTLGTVSNREHQTIILGKAGRNRYRGFRPKVRGVAMNACDHPHGGGRGKSKSNKVSQSPWGLKKFARTRKFKKVNKMKIQDRPRR
ncbi:54S ribosomal protein Rml2p, mitochondrial [[Candida] anglica]